MKRYIMVFVEDTSSNDWDGIFDVDIEEVSITALKEGLRDIKEEIQRRG